MTSVLMFSRPKKKVKITHTRHSLLSKDEDFFHLLAHEVLVDRHGKAKTQPVSPQKHKHDWTSRESWFPEDPREYGLDTAESYEEAINTDVFPVERMSDPVKENLPNKICRRDLTNTGAKTLNRNFWRNYFDMRVEETLVVRNHVRTVKRRVRADRDLPQFGVEIVLLECCSVAIAVCIDIVMNHCTGLRYIYLPAWLSYWNLFLHRSGTTIHLNKHP